MQGVMKKDGRLGEWRKMIADVCTQYRRRRNLVKKLDELKRERGISNRIADYMRG